MKFLRVGVGREVLLEHPCCPYTGNRHSAEGIFPTESLRSSVDGLIAGQICIETDRNERESLKASLDKMEKQVTDSSFRHELENLRGKVDILAMENDRLENVNRELQQTVSAMEERKANDKKVIQTLKDASEDVTAKFDTLGGDLRQTKVVDGSTDSRVTSAA